MDAPAVLLIAPASVAAANYRQALEQAGFTVRQAQDGLTGMHHALADPPDLVILDFSADEAADVLRSRRALREADIPLLVLASGRVTADDPRAHDPGVSFLEAPVSTDRLASESSTIIERRLHRQDHSAGNGGHPV